MLVPATTALIAFAAHPGGAPLVVAPSATALGVALLLGLVRRPAPSAALAGCALALVLGSFTSLTAGTPLTRSVSLVALPLVVPLALLSQARGRRWWVWLVVVGGLVAGPVRSLVYDPLRDLECLGCLPGGLVARPDIAAAEWLAVAGGAVVVFGAAVGTVIERRLAVGLLAAAAVVAVLEWRTPLGVSTEAALAAAWLAAAAAGLEVAQAMWARRHLRLLAEGQAADPTHAVRRALGVADLEVWYDLDDTWCDAAGFLVPARDGGERTLVRVGDEVVAVLVHETDLRTPLSPELVLGLASARLGARLARQERELAMARTRLVERADAEARLLERDLHDGAQQHLLRLAMDMRLALDDAPLADHDRLTRGVATVMACLEEVREISHGIYPPLLGDAGLMPALSALTRYAAVPLSVAGVPRERLSETAERTAYLTVLDTVLRATAPVQITASIDGTDLALEISGPPPTADSLLYDRVAATGGTVTPAARDSADGLVVRIPCA